MTLFAPETPACAHGRTAGEVCPWCQAAEPPFVAGSSTSYEAAQAIKPDRARFKKMVYQAIEAHPGICDEQISELTGLEGSTARPRRIEIQREGRIEFCGYTRTQAGRKAKAWRVVPGK